MGRASSRYSSATNLARTAAAAAAGDGLDEPKSGELGTGVATRASSAATESAQLTTATGARQPIECSHCACQGCCSGSPDPFSPVADANNWRHSDVACGAGGDVPPVEAFEPSVKFRRAARRVSHARIVDTAFAFIHDIDDDGDERVCDSCGFFEAQRAAEQQLHPPDPLEAAAGKDFNQRPKPPPELINEHHQVLVSQSGELSNNNETSNDNRSQDKAAEAAGCANYHDITSTCACSDYCCLICDLSTLPGEPAAAAAAGAISKQTKPPAMHYPHKPQLATIKERAGSTRAESSANVNANANGQRQQPQVVDLELRLGAAQAPTATALPVLPLSPAELMRSSSYVALHRTRYERTKQQQQQPGVNSNKLGANINCDVHTLLSGPGDINWRLINRRALIGDNGLLSEEVESSKRTRKLEDKLANNQSSDENDNNIDSTGEARTSKNMSGGQSSEDKRSHMDWQNVAERFGKMPYRHKGHMWWKLRQSCFCHFFLSTLNFLFPIFTSFRGYSLPGNLITDLMTGFTVGILHIPQGMAYGLLAGVDPIHGLYVSIVPVLVMAMMSKSVHMSYGTFAVISILLASCTESVKQSLRLQMSLVAGASLNNQSQAGFLSDLPMADTSASTSTTTTSPMTQRQQLNRKHDLSSGDNELANDALVLTNNHRPSDPGQQLLKQLLIPGQTLLPGPAADLEPDQSSSAWSSTLAQLAPQSEFIMPSNIEILTCICLLVGLIQMAMALMRLGVLSLMFSDQLVSSFTTASAVHVATSQLGNVFDLNTPRVPEGLFKVCRTWLVFGTKLLEGFNQYTALLSLISILFLLNIKEIIEPYLKRRYKLATCIPAELVLMSVLVVCSWFWQFNSEHGIHIVGTVPTGLPVPKAPRLDLVPLVVQDALTVAVVSFAMNLSLAQVCAKKFRYRLNPNQELFALGSSNLVGSFFSCFPCASSLSRTAVQSNLNAKSQISSLFSCAIVVSVVCYFAPFFYNLPRSTLSCIILVNLKGILVQVKDFFENWRLSKLDALVWLATFMFVLAFDVTYGLILGILTSLSMVFYRLLTPNYSILGQLPDTEIYVDKSAFAECNEIDHVKIFRFNSALCYLNREMFKSGIERLLRSANNHSTGFLCPEQLKQQLQSGCKPNRVDYLIIDCSALSYCDYSGVATLIEIIEELEEQRTVVFLASCPLKLVNMIEKVQKPNVLEHNVYPSITDAINQARYLKSRNALSSSLSSSADETCLQTVISVAPK